MPIIYNIGSCHASCTRCIAVLLPLKADRKLTHPSAEDGKEMKLNLSNMRITEVMEQVDRHSRMLARKEELTGH